MVEENWEWVEVGLLKLDNDNPNSMTREEQKALRANIEKYGWNMPIITDMNYLVADGEQKLSVAKQMGLLKVPILRKELSDIDRRIIRQSMNKLRGSHNPVLDAEEFKKILSEFEMEKLSGLTGISEQEIIGLLNVLNREELPKISDPNLVEKLYVQEVTCPNCNFVFKKAA